MLTITDLHFTVAHRPLLTGANARIPAGRKVGLVGANGAGKTTLLRIVLGQLEPDRGTVTLRRGCRVGTVPQDPPGGEQTPVEAVLAADARLQDLERQAVSAADPTAVAEIHEQLAHLEAHTAETRARTILAGLGFSTVDQDRPLSTFSGGWRMRVALAGALFTAPDLLLLDEPTNHLDLESIVWLANHLRTYPHTVVVVSHNRDFLDEVTDATMWLHDGVLDWYTGNFDSFLRQRTQKMVHLAAQAAKQDAERAHLESFVRRFRAKARLAKQAQSRIKRLEKMTPVARLETEKAVHIRFPDPQAPPACVCTVRDAAVGYVPDAPVLHNVSFSLYPEDKVALLGANGNGKSTLARLIVGSLAPLSGERVVPQNTVVGYFAQDHLERLHPDWTALEQAAAAMPDASPQQVRDWLGRFGFADVRQEVLVGRLSGGEKTRLALALAVVDRPNLLVLDEPTNHLDMATREALMDAINAYRGAVVLISHDRRLIETTCDQLWLVEDQTCAPFFGDLDDYKAALLKARATQRASRTSPANKGMSRKEQRRQAADARRKLAPLKRAVEQAEAHLNALTAQRSQLDAAMGDPAFYTRPAEEIARITAEHRRLEEAIAAAEEAWLEAASALEALADTSPSG